MFGRTMCSLVIAGLLSLAGTTQAAIPASERTVLLDFYTSTGGATWTTSTNWNGAAGTECTWYGVTCDVGGTTVTSISLPGKNLTGSLPSNLNSLTNLDYFNVYNNHLTGPIPTLTGLTTLTSFRVDNNMLTGSIPALTGLNNLTQFLVNDNHLTGPIPTLIDLTNLASFQGGNNQLTGSIPTLTGLLNLVSFFVGQNLLTGSVPELTGLTKLGYFRVDTNQLTGSIPALTGLTNLTEFFVNDNHLAGPIPALTGLTKLTYFFANSNQLTGSIPALTGLTTLTSFRVDTNLLGGSIPELTGLTNLANVWVNNNQLTGPIPALTGLTKLGYFDVNTNLLTGSIPALTGLTNLRFFLVNNNQLTGPIPELTDLTKLVRFSVGTNQLTGNVPSVPSPSALVAGGSSLCPNFLAHTLDPAWDAATGVTPWYTNCVGTVPPPTFQSAALRKVHGTAGTFDLALSLITTNPTTETRNGPAQTIVMTFDKPIASASNPTVTEGAATFATISYAGNDVILNFTGVANLQYVTFNLANVTAADGGMGGTGSVRVGFLFGDANQSRQVTVADVGIVNAALLQTVTNSNFLLDVNADGRLTVADKGLANANLLKKLPSP